MSKFKVGDKVRFPDLKMYGEVTTGTVAECYPDVNFYAVDVDVKIRENTAFLRGIFRGNDLVLLDTPDIQDGKNESIK
jgi:hypothetical protein